MSIDMYLSSSDQQSETAGVTLRHQIAAYEGLQASLNQFILASPTLSGKTYESAKAYSSQVLLPLIRACILLDEAVIVATEELPQRYRQEVDVIDLKEWELQEQIDRASGLISRYEDLVRTELWKDLPNYDYLNSLRQSISNYEDTKYHLEEKLRKLIEFNWHSASIFTAAEDLCYVVQEGMRQANASWNGEAQAFTLPSREQLSWMAGVNQKWTERKNQFEREVDRLSLAELECKYKDVLKANPNTVYIGAGYDGRYVGLKLSPDQAEYIRSRYQILKAQGQETLFVKQIYDNLRGEDKEEIDKLTLHELTTAYPYLILPRGSSFEFGSEADYAKKNYLYHRFEHLMAKEPIDWRDPQFMEKLNDQINETGINPLTGKEATEGEKRTAQYYGPAKYGSNILGLITLLAGPSAITKYYEGQTFSSSPIAIETFDDWDAMKNAHKGTVTEFIKVNKPKGSPIPKNWFEKGGSLAIETLPDGNQIWKYTNADGVTVPYMQKTINNQTIGVPDFSNHLYSNKNIADINIGEFTGDRRKDFVTFLQQTGLDDIPEGYVLHHGYTNGELQLIDSVVHGEFSHIGGHSLFKP